jgi:hypothetical protein
MICWMQIDEKIDQRGDDKVVVKEEKEQREVE